MQINTKFNEEDRVVWLGEDRKITDVSVWATQGKVEIEYRLQDSRESWAHEGVWVSESDLAKVQDVRM